WGYVGAKSRQRWLFYAYEGSEVQPCEKPR
ncbi:IS1 family transposase, partial [Klebsiella pneumoniae]